MKKGCALRLLFPGGGKGALGAFSAGSRRVVFALLSKKGGWLRPPQRGGVLLLLEEGGTFAPRSGARVLFLLKEGENVCAPHFFFSRERKRNVPRPVQRKRALGAAFVTKAAPFSFVLYVLVAGVLVLCGLVSPFAPLTLRGAGALMDYRSIW